jgi:hypothetical protein
MELENWVAQELKDRGYPIYFRNFEFRNGKIAITEYDIICHDFIIEVKSGNDIGLRTQIVQQLKFLPKGYKLYYFCKIKTDEEINDLNEICKYDDVEYINNLDQIYKNHKPIKIFNIDSQRNFTKFLSQSIEELSSIDKIYVDNESFYYSYLSFKYINDYLSIKDNKYTSEKINYLIEMNKIEIVDSFSLSFPFITTQTLKRNVNILESNQINFRQFYTLDWKKSYLEIYEFNLEKNNLPIIDDFTKICSVCNNCIIFKKQDMCGECNRKNI